MPFLVSKPDGPLAGTACEMSPANIHGHKKSRDGMRGEKDTFEESGKAAEGNWCQKGGMREKHGCADTLVMSSLTS